MACRSRISAAISASLRSVGQKVMTVSRMIGFQIAAIPRASAAVAGRAHQAQRRLWVPVCLSHTAAPCRDLASMLEVDAQ